MFTPRKIALNLMRQQGNSNATGSDNNVINDRIVSKDKDSDLHDNLTHEKSLIGGRNGGPEQKELSNTLQATSERRDREALLDKVSTQEKEGNSNATGSDNNAINDRIISKEKDSGLHDNLTHEKSLMGSRKGGPEQKELSNPHQATSERRDRGALLDKVLTQEKELPDSQSNEEREKISDKTSEGGLYSNLPFPKSSSGTASEAVMNERFEARKKSEALLEKMSGVENKVGFTKEIAADMQSLSGPLYQGYCHCAKPWDCKSCSANILTMLERLPNCKSALDELNTYIKSSIAMADKGIFTRSDLMVKWKVLNKKLMRDLKAKLYLIYCVPPPVFKIESDNSFTL